MSIDQKKQIRIVNFSRELFARSFEMTDNDFKVTAQRCMEASVAIEKECESYLSSISSEIKKIKGGFFVMGNTSLLETKLISEKWVQVKDQSGRWEKSGIDKRDPYLKVLMKIKGIAIGEL